MTLQINLSNRARKAYLRIPKPWQVRIGRAIHVLANNPYEGKKLSGEHEGRYAVRVWPYRIIYRIEKEKLIVFVLKIDHRKDVYR